MQSEQWRFLLARLSHSTVATSPGHRGNRGDQRNFHLRRQKLRFTCRILFRQHVHRLEHCAIEERKSRCQEHRSPLRLQSRPEHEQSEFFERNISSTPRTKPEQPAARPSQVGRQPVRQSSSKDESKRNERADQNMSAL